MHGAHDFLRNLALILCVAAVTTVVFQRLRQPVVLGYLLAGLLVGPHFRLPLVASSEVAHTLSELGVILLMFSLGLEFSLRRLLRVGPASTVIAVLECSLMMWLGHLAGQLLGWGFRERLFAGALVAISSTTIIVKAFAERRVDARLRELVFGILIVEDLIAIILLALLTAVASGTGLDAGALALTVGRLGAFLVGLVVVGLLVVPRLVRLVVRLERPETTLVASVGLCFALALLARSMGYSVALGAFLAGSLVAESGEGRHVEHLIHPVRDMFAAIFFVAVGMLIDPALIVRYWPAVLLLTAVVVCGKVLSVSVSAFLAGKPVHAAVQAGMSLAQIGEFSFIIAGVGMTLGRRGALLYPLAVAVSAVTTLTTPWLIRASDPVSKFVDRRLPRALQTFSALYGSWLEQLLTSPRSETTAARLHRGARVLLVDVAFLAVIPVGAALFSESLRGLVRARAGREVSGVLVATAAALLCIPFLVGAVRTVRQLGALLAVQALPASRPGRVDLAAAPRRALVVTLQLGLLMLVGVPLVAITQPFVPGVPLSGLLALGLGALAIAFWRSATNLQGHVRAGAQMIVEVLAKQARGAEVAAAPGSAGEPSGDDAMADVHRILPGLGEPAAYRVEEDSAAVGHTLAELNLRGLTGATVLCITRGEQGIPVPAGGETLQAGDVLALAGSHEAVEAAKALLASVGPRESGEPGAA